MELPRAQHHARGAVRKQQSSANEKGSLARLPRV